MNTDDFAGMSDGTRVVEENVRKLRRQLAIKISQHMRVKGMAARESSPVRFLQWLYLRINVVRTDARIFKLEAPHVITGIPPHTPQNINRHWEIVRIEPGTDRAPNIE